MAGRLRETRSTLSIAPLDTGLHVVGGHVRLQQVLVNLVNNAIDAAEGQKDAKVDITFADKDDRLAVIIRDHGPGIREDVFERIFDPFFTTKGINQGLGLGLSISFNILRDFGGDLDARNHPDGGAVFTATLVKVQTVGEGI